MVIVGPWSLLLQRAIVTAPVLACFLHDTAYEVHLNLNNLEINTTLLFSLIVVICLAELMAYEQNFQDYQEPMAQFESEGDVSLKQNWELNSASATAAENANGCFDCNICLDSAHDPVVTLCGHLYCWPCIYKWLHVQTTASFESNEPPKCPVCKAKISESSLVPLYGRGNSSSESNLKRPHRDVVPPRRPPALGVDTTVASHQNHQLHAHPFHSLPQPLQHQQFFPHPNYGNYASMAASNFGGMAMTGIFPTVGMFGEMVFARMFGNSDPSLFPYPYSSTAYPFMGNGSPRLRRQEMQLDKSLNRVCIFLFCCFILCLILF